MYLKDIHLQQIFAIKDICCNLEKKILKLQKRMVYGDMKTKDKNKFFVDFVKTYLRLNSN